MNPQTNQQGKDPKNNGNGANPPPVSPADAAFSQSQGESAVTADDNRAAELEVQLKELTAQVSKLTDLAARAQADLQNAKMRMEKDADELRKFASQSIILRLLPVIDNFQRAFQHLPDDLKSHEWVKGVSAIEQNMMKIFTDMGLRRFDSLGQPVDTARHEVITMGPGEEGIIVEVLEDGYELNGRVIRPARVKVGSGMGG